MCVLYQSFTSWNGRRKKRRMVSCWMNVCNIVSCTVIPLDMLGKDQHLGRFSPLHSKLFRLPFSEIVHLNSKLLVNVTIWRTWLYSAHLLRCGNSCFIYYICVCSLRWFPWWIQFLTVSFINSICIPFYCFINHNSKTNMVNTVTLWYLDTYWCTIACSEKEIYRVWVNLNISA